MRSEARKEATVDAIVQGSVGAAVKLSDVLSAEEMAPFMVRSDGRAWLMVMVNFVIIGAAFALPVLWFNPVTVIASLLLLGARQLGMAVIYHDCSHGVFFRTRWLNDLIGHWVAGGLLNTSMYAYRAYHLKHHKFAGTVDDPDLGIASAYPTTKASLKRKLTRDVTGQTGWKAMKAQAAKFGPRRNLPLLLSHAVLFSILWFAGAPWAYLLWWLAYVFVHQLVTRLRFIGEHGVALDRLSPDARENTCTTVISWWERLLLAPNFVNYHLEHHLSAAVPCYRLPALHGLLVDKGFYNDHACLSQGYRNVLAKAISRPTPMPEAA
jgi:fatty acid desaturase